MGILDVIKRKTGVIVGDDVRAVFDYAKEHKFAIPAINVTSSSTVVAALEAARDNKCPIILQTSNGGAAFFAGKGVSNEGQNAAIRGSIAAAHYIRSIASAYEIPIILHSDHCAKKLLPWFDGMLAADEAYFQVHGEPLFSSHMIDLSEESDEENIATCVQYFTRASKMQQWLEMEIGITGGEEDGVNNENVDKDSLYTKAEQVFSVYKALSPISPNFSIAAAFGNVHGVYAGTMALAPEILADHQAYTAKQIGAPAGSKPLYLVFHGGSGSTDEQFHIGIENGVVKVNLDTDCQYAYLQGIRDYVLAKKDFIMSMVGNPTGADSPNKKYFDPRVWVREGEKTMTKRIVHAFEVFRTQNTL